MSEIQGILDPLLDHLLIDAEQASKKLGWVTRGEPNMATVSAVARDLCHQLQEAEKSGYLRPIPKGLRQRLLDRLANLTWFAAEIAEGRDQIDSFVTEVDLLDEVVWDLGIRYKGKRLLALDAKLEEIAQLRYELKELLNASAAINTVIQDVHNAQESAYQTLESVQRIHTDSANTYQNLNLIAEDADRQQSLINELLKSAESSAKSISDYEETAMADTKAANTSLIALQAYYNQVDVYERKLNKITRDATELTRKVEDDYKTLADKLEHSTSAAISASTVEHSKLLAELFEVEERAYSLLEKATGVSLFHAFEKRQIAVKIGLTKWLYMSAVLIVLSVIYSAAVLATAGSFDAVFYAKLGFSLTFFVGITFTLNQYRKERRLEEEYAFKAAMSVSLEAYRNLVEQALDNLTPAERTEYATFLTKSVGVIFDPPSDRVFGDKRTRIPSDSKVIASIAESIKPITDLMRPQK